MRRRGSVGTGDTMTKLLKPNDFQNTAVSLCATSRFGRDGTMTKLLKPNDFQNTAVSLSGAVDYDMYKDFRRQLESAPTRGWSRSSFPRSAATPKWRG